MNILWDYIVNQERARENLRKIFTSSYYPPAILFTGQAGVGKEAVAFAFAQSINCEKKSFNEKKSFKPCGECNPCKSIANYNFPYINFIYPLPLGKNETPGDDPYQKLPLEIIQEINSAMEKKKPILTLN